MPTLASATNNELIGVLGVAALIAAILVYVQTPKIPVLPAQPTVVVKQPQVVVKPAQWDGGGVGPGWSSGHWLGEGDFKHFGSMDHPFHNPMPLQGMRMMPPLGGTMGPTRY